MIDLTFHLTSAEQKKIGPLLLSDGAASELHSFLSAYAPTHADLEQCGPIVARSVAGFLMSDYFARSTWFQSESVHVSPVCLVSGGNDERALNCHIVKSACAYVIVAAAEQLLSENYFERRLIEELRVEHGLPEPTERPLGRRRKA